MAKLEKEIDELRQVLKEKELQFFSRHRQLTDCTPCIESNKYNKHLSNKEITRYSRQIFLMQSFKLQCRMKNKAVLMVGCGSLGCICAMYLTTAGVGSLTLVDNGIVKATNLPGQIFYNEDDIGKFIANCIFEKLSR